MKEPNIPTDFKVPDDYRVITYAFHLGDLIGGTAHLTNAQYGGYMRILLALINKPDGITFKQAKSYSRMAGRYWNEFWDLIGDKFVEENGKIHHERVRDTVRKQAYKSHQNRDNALKRHNSGDADAMQKDSERNANHSTSNPYKESLNRYDVEMFLKDEDWERYRRKFQGWDIKALAQDFNAWVIKKGIRPDHPANMFYKFIQTNTEGKTP